MNLTFSSSYLSKYIYFYLDVRAHPAIFFEEAWPSDFYCYLLFWWVLFFFWFLPFFLKKRFILLSRIQDPWSWWNDCIRGFEELFVRSKKPITNRTKIMRSDLNFNRRTTVCRKTFAHSTEISSLVFGFIFVLISDSKISIFFQFSFFTNIILFASIQICNKKYVK